MQENKLPASLLLRISGVVLLAFVLACCAHRHEKQPASQGQLKEMPKPGVQNPEQADSLKRAIDQERQRRLKEKNK